LDPGKSPGWNSKSHIQGGVTAAIEATASKLIELGKGKGAIGSSEVGVQYPLQRLVFRTGNQGEPGSFLHQVFP